MAQDKVLGILHDVRGKLHVAKELVHFHMSGDQRFQAETALEEVTTLLGSLWSQCLSCSMSSGKEKSDALDGL